MGAEWEALLRFFLEPLVLTFRCEIEFQGVEKPVDHLLTSFHAFDEVEMLGQVRRKETLLHDHFSCCVSVETEDHWRGKVILVLETEFHVSNYFLRPPELPNMVQSLRSPIWHLLNDGDSIWATRALIQAFL
jgi:hypothetical protein